MKRLNKMTLENLLTIKSEALRVLLDETAHKTGKDCWLYKPVNTQSKICIVAHIDTVFDDDFSRYQSWTSGKKWNPITKQWEEKEVISKPRRVFLDEKKGVYWSPDGLGADDRAGMFAGFHLFNTIPEEHRPFLLLTDYEEVGGVGAREVYKSFPELQWVTMFLELDRQGKDDIVVYQDEGKDFIEYLENFGFSKAFGSYSDISTFCPEFMICGANLSIGYYGQHTKQEYLVESELWATVEKVRKICADNSKVWIMPEKPVYVQHLIGYANEGYTGGAYKGYTSEGYPGQDSLFPYVCPVCEIDLTEAELYQDGQCPYCYTELIGMEGQATCAEPAVGCVYCGRDLEAGDIRKDKDNDICCERCEAYFAGLDGEEKDKAVLIG